MLRTLPERYKTLWKDHVNKVIHFGCKSRLPINIILQTEVDPPHNTHRQYLENWKEVIEHVYVAAPQN